MLTIRGTVERTGAIKEYIQNKGYMGAEYRLKFYMRINTEEYGTVNVMVDVDDELENDEEVIIPSKNSIVSFEYGRRPKPNDNGDKWVNIPYSRLHIEESQESKVELHGVVERVGRLKDDGRFYMLVNTEELGEVNVMVKNSKYRDSMDNWHTRPFVNDIIAFTGEVDEGRDGSYWVNIYHDEWKTIDARGKNKYYEQKKAEREARKEAEKKEKMELENEIIMSIADDEVRNALLTARDGAESLLSLNRIIDVLRDTFWFSPIEVGYGGEMHKNTRGEDLGSFAGIGMRNPSGALYSLPFPHRKTILQRMENAGLIRFLGVDEELQGAYERGDYENIGEDAGWTYEATDLGFITLMMLDVDDEGNIRKPYHWKRTFGKYHQYKEEGISYCSDKEHEERNCGTPINHDRLMEQ